LKENGVSTQSEPGKCGGTSDVVVVVVVVVVSVVVVVVVVVVKLVGPPHVG